MQEAVQAGVAVPIPAIASEKRVLELYKKIPLTCPNGSVVIQTETLRMIFKGNLLSDKAIDYTGIIINWVLTARPSALHF